MKILLILLSFLTFQSFAQLNLKFDKPFVQCEDQWVAFPSSEDGSHRYGFIYIDPQAGLTFNNEGIFKVEEDGTVETHKIKDSNIKVRLEPNEIKVAIIPASLYAALEIEETPDWLKHYKTDIHTVDRNYKWGYRYNGWGECQRALPFLLKAKSIDPNYEGLGVEIAYSYNCMKEYTKAIDILKAEIQKHPQDAYVIKEYIYSISKTKDVSKAEKKYFESLKTIENNPYNAENCFNILQFHYNQQDKKNVNKWYKELKKWPNNNKLIDQYAEIFKDNLK